MLAGEERDCSWLLLSSASVRTLARQGQGVSAEKMIDGWRVQIFAQTLSGLKESIVCCCCQLAVVLWRELEEKSWVQYIKYHILFLPCSSEARDDAHVLPRSGPNRSPNIHRARHCEVLASALPPQSLLTQQLHSSNTCTADSTSPSRVIQYSTARLTRETSLDTLRHWPDHINAR